MRDLRILLVDDHEVVRLGLKALLGRHPRFEVVGEAGTADEALAKARVQRPDVVVMDVRLPGKSGIEATREITEALPETKVIILTSYADDELLMDAVAAGATGYVLKQIGSDDLVRSLEAVARGEALLDPAMMNKAFARLREAARKDRGEAFKMLTEQEVKIIALVARGRTNREIASELFLSEKTVRNYVSSILGKLGLSHRSQAAAYAVEHGLPGVTQEE
ncbi:MAG: response regulator transcription factor [Chloroflexi bacterium]|nr:response regulator transcription factor [Chloroflexota bacterium]